MAKEKIIAKETDEREVSFKMSYGFGMKRVYFNRFSFRKDIGSSFVRVWFQDENMRVCNAYSFVMDDEDFRLCSKSIKNYIQKVMATGKSNDMSARSDVFTDEFHEIDIARTMTCSRTGDRGEIYLGYIPLAMLVSSDNLPNDMTIPMNTALCSGIGCHLELLRLLVG